MGRFAPGDKDLRWATCRRPRPDGGDDGGNDGGDDGGNDGGDVPGVLDGGDDDGPILLAAVRGVVRTDQDLCCDALVTTDLAARQRSVVLSYLETLLEYARAAMCKGTRTVKVD